MAESPAPLLAIVQKLHRKERPKRVSVKTLLKWFGAKKRGANVIAKIEDTFRAAGLATDPELAKADYDDYLTFRLIGEGQQTTSPPVCVNDRNPVESEPLPEETVE